MLNRLSIIIVSILIFILLQPHSYAVSQIESSELFSKPIQADFQSTNISWSPDGDILAIHESDSALCLYDGHTFELLPITIDDFTSTQVVTMIFSDENTLVTGHIDGTIRKWDIRTGSQLDVLEAHESPVTAIDVSPDRTLIASGVRDQDIVRIWDYETLALVDEFERSVDGIFLVNFSPDSQWLAFSGLSDEIVLWHYDEEYRSLYKLPRPELIGDRIGPSAFVHNGEFLIATTPRYLGAIVAWNVETKTFMQVRLSGEEVYFAIFSNILGGVVAITKSDAVIIYDVIVEDEQVELSRVATFSKHDGTPVVALNPMGTVVAYDDATVRIRDIETRADIDYEWCR